MRKQKKRPTFLVIFSIFIKKNIEWKYSQTLSKKKITKVYNFRQFDNFIQLAYFLTHVQLKLNKF